MRRPHVLWALPTAAAALVIAAPRASELVQTAPASVGPGPAVVDQPESEAALPGAATVIGPTTSVDESLPGVDGGAESPPAQVRTGQGPSTTVESVPIKSAPETHSNSIANGPLPVDVSSTLACIRAHESDTAGGYEAVNPNGHYGAYQFSPGTWASVGGKGNPAEASPAEQDQRAAELLARRGTQPWGGVCS